MAAHQGTFLLVNFARDMGLDRAPPCVRPFLDDNERSLELYISVEGCHATGNHHRIPVLCLQFSPTSQQVDYFPRRSRLVGHELTASMWPPSNHCLLYHTDAAHG